MNNTTHTKDMRAAMFSSSSIFPPFKDGGDSEKDYIHDNMRRVRQSSSQVKLGKGAPLKAKFIPGVTKNPKFEHVGSRVAGLIRGIPKRASDDLAIGSAKSLSNSTIQLQLNGNRKKDEQNIKPIWGASQASNSRRTLSRSSTDLRKAESSSNKLCHEVPSFLRRKPRPPPPQEESVYNWKFSNTNNYPRSFVEKQRTDQPDKFTKFQSAKDLHLHRVEYVPCDGICAEETHEVTPHNGDSGRSSSSSRTSRGMNTEETRIFPNEGQAQSCDHFENEVHPYEKNNSSAFSKTKPFHAQPLYPNSLSHADNLNFVKRIERGGGDGDMLNVEKGFSNMKLNGGGNPGSRTVSTSAVSQNGLGPAGDQQGSHAVGVVPKYLKDRQQQWKVEAEAKKEAEKLADVPPGHTLMPEAERQQTLADLKRSYDKLVNDLNRIPIHVDTMRIREHKISLEQQLTKLEQAMRVLSRPKVYIKNDQ